MGPVAVSEEGRVATIRMHDPARRNALGPAMLDGLLAAFDGFGDRDIRAVVLRAGPADDDSWENATQEEIEAEMAVHGAFAEAVAQRATLLGGEALAAPGESITLRPSADGGPRTVTDGPYAESAEQIGGYYVIDVANLDEALDWAARIPNSHFGTVEVRPVMEFEG